MAGVSVLSWMRIHDDREAPGWTEAVTVMVVADFLSLSGVFR